MHNAVWGMGVQETVISPHFRRCGRTVRDRRETPYGVCTVRRVSNVYMPVEVATKNSQARQRRYDVLDDVTGKYGCSPRAPAGATPGKPKMEVVTQASERRRMQPTAAERCSEIAEPAADAQQPATCNMPSSTPGEEE